MSSDTRRAWAQVDLDAVRENAAALAALAAPAALCAVVKAGGYGHGAVPVARAALEGGASWLAVALVEEGVELREAGLASPVLLLSEPPAAAMSEVVARGLTPTLYTQGGVEAAAKAVAATDDGRQLRSGHAGRPLRSGHAGRPLRSGHAGRPLRSGHAGRPLGVHVKVDSGMHRVGAAPDQAVQVATAVDERPELRLDGLWTHFATADDPDPSFTALQSACFEEVVTRLAAAGVRPSVLHACNSAGAIAHPEAHHDLVRCGLALFGVPPAPALAGRVALRPVLSFRARVSLVKSVAGGEGISYGLRHRFARDSVVATVPVGYADGIPWRMGVNGGEVLVRGRRRPIAGAVTMDQITVDCGDDPDVVPGDEVVLLGRQGDESVDAWEWAGRAGTIAYEILCGIGPRVPRIYV